ncbi:hypothetical protein BMMON3_39570 [Burkholderia mallei]
MRGFLERLARDRFDERLAGLEVAGGLVDAQAGRRVFFDHEKAPVAFDDRGDRHVRGPDFGFHSRAFYRLRRAAAERAYSAVPTPRNSPVWPARTRAGGGKGSHCGIVAAFG